MELGVFFLFFFLSAPLWMDGVWPLLLSALPGQAGWAGCFRADMTDWLCLSCLLAWRVLGFAVLCCAVMLVLVGGGKWIRWLLARVLRRGVARFACLGDGLLAVVQEPVRVAHIFACTF